MIPEKLIDAVVPSPAQILDLIVRAEEHKKIVWTAGRVLKEAALWTRAEELDYEERKAVLKRLTASLEDFASREFFSIAPNHRASAMETRLDSTTFARKNPACECNRSVFAN